MIKAPSNSDAKNVVVYCEIMTNGGKQCSRPRTKTVNGTSYCTQHYKSRKDKTKLSIKDMEPWVQLGIVAPFESNGARVLQKIRSKLKAGPAASDGKGYIYIYHLAHERHLDYWKIGRTEQTVDSRLKQWQEEHKGHRVVLSRKYEVPYNKWAESLIHLYLAYCRMHRYPYGKGFHSVWALDPNEVIQDGQEVPVDQRGKHKIAAMHKHIEWFKCKREEMLEVTDAICDVLCKKVKPLPPRSGDSDKKDQ